MTKRFLLVLTLVLATCCYFGPTPESKAIDPVTIAILAPFAIQAAKTLMPYVIKALSNMTKVMVRAGGHLLNFLRLPLGLLQTTLLAPWCFSSGMRNIWKGSIAPFKMGGNLLLLPLSAFGIGV